MSEIFVLGFVVDQSAKFVHVVVDGTSAVEINFAGHKVEVIPPVFLPATESKHEVRVKSHKDITHISANGIDIDVDWENRKITLPSSCETLMSTRLTQGKGLTLNLRTDVNMEYCLAQNLREAAVLQG